MARVIIYPIFKCINHIFKCKSDYRKARDSFCRIMQQKCQQYFLCFLLPPSTRFWETSQHDNTVSCCLTFFLHSRYLKKYRTRNNVDPPSFDTARSDSLRILLKYSWLLLALASWQECCLQIPNFHLVNILIQKIVMLGQPSMRLANVSLTYLGWNFG